MTAPTTKLKTTKLLIFHRSMFAPLGIPAEMLIETAISRNQLADAPLWAMLPRKNPLAPKIPHACDPIVAATSLPAVKCASSGPVTGAAFSLPIPPHISAYPQTKKPVMLKT